MPLPARRIGASPATTAGSGMRAISLPMAARFLLRRIAYVEETRNCAWA